MPQRLAHGLATHRFPYPGGLVAARGHDPFSIWTKGRIPYVFIMSHCLADRFSAGRLPKPGSLVRTRRDYPFSVRTKACAVDNAIVTCAVPSSLAVSTHLPSGLKTALLTRPSCFKASP